MMTGNAVVTTLPYYIVYLNCFDSVVFLRFFPFYLNYIIFLPRHCIFLETKLRKKIFISFLISVAVVMVVGFTTTYAISAYHHWCCEFESRSGRGAQHYVLTFVSDLRQVDGFLRVILFPPPIKLTATI
jgi:hypothetical protein